MIFFHLKWPLFHNVKITRGHVDIMYNGTFLGIYTYQKEQDPTDGRATRDKKIRVHRAVAAIVAAYGVKCDKNIQVPHYMWDLTTPHNNL